MSVLNQLASATGNRNEIPNQVLAAKIAESRDKSAVKELVENLENKRKDIQGDCIKTLYEIGEKKPELVSPYHAEFIKLLKHKNPRMVWGGMSALSAIAPMVPDALYKALPEIIDTADHSGSVIARDHAMYILASLAVHKKYYDNCFELIREQLLKAPANQFPMYAEITAPIVQEKDKAAYRTILEERLETIDLPAKRKRIEKVIKKMKFEI
jgi:hypothetical protein